MAVCGCDSGFGVLLTDLWQGGIGCAMLKGGVLGCGQAEEEAAAQAAAELATMKTALPPEPPAGDGVCTVVVRLKDGRYHLPPLPLALLPPSLSLSLCRARVCLSVAHLFVYVSMALRIVVGWHVGIWSMTQPATATKIQRH